VYLYVPYESYSEYFPKEFKVKVRPLVGQSVLVSTPPPPPPIWGPRPIFVTVRQLWVCWCAAPFLTRRRVCRLQLLVVLVSAVIFASESRGSHDHILLTQIRDSPNLEGQVPVFISPMSRVARLYPQALGSFSLPPTTHRVTVEVFEPASTRGAKQH
jgi:hypothetical protein